MTKKEGGAADAKIIKRGAPPKMTGGQRKQVFLDDASVEEAKRLGKGEVSAGIRIALKHTAQSAYNPPGYRAAYWSDGQSSVCLTAEEHSELPEHELLIEAVRQVRDTGLKIGNGRIMIGDYKAK
ncbi:hypothetical protein RBA41_28490 [Massilia sp. CCM 9210]|uniref:hypothetical protein n=1 Tax=Massilia scottii TaxID=3057166 RepID=UPI002796DC87|nr:hypothetical protein [Massilia sp. CCM 9210]MDQ1817250.1 hypothetical protein [Massilia sp. CCM 9210]